MSDDRWGLTEEGEHKYENTTFVPVSHEVMRIWINDTTFDGVPVVDILREARLLILYESIPIQQAENMERAAALLQALCGTAETGE